MTYSLFSDMALAQRRYAPRVGLILLEPGGKVKSDARRSG